MTTKKSTKDKKEQKDKVKYRWCVLQKHPAFIGSYFDTKADARAWFAAHREKYKLGPATFQLLALVGDPIEIG